MIKSSLCLLFLPSFLFITFVIGSSEEEPNVEGKSAIFHPPLAIIVDRNVEKKINKYGEYEETPLKKYWPKRKKTPYVPSPVTITKEITVLPAFPNNQNRRPVLVSISDSTNQRPPVTIIKAGGPNNNFNKNKFEEQEEETKKPPIVIIKERNGCWTKTECCSQCYKFDYANCERELCNRCICDYHLNKNIESLNLIE